jgi:hypothetical protein
MATRLQYSPNINNTANNIQQPMRPKASKNSRGSYSSNTYYQDAQTRSYPNVEMAQQMPQVNKIYFIFLSIFF